MKPRIFWRMALMLLVTFMAQAMAGGQEIDYRAIGGTILKGSWRLTTVSPVGGLVAGGPQVVRTHGSSAV